MKKAYVTTLCNGDGYLPGVLVLGRSLEATGTQADRVVMVTPDVTTDAREELAKRGWAVRLVDPVANPSLDKMLYPRFETVFTKLCAWQLSDYERVVLLDADTLVLQNVDDLFDRPGFAAAPDFFMPDRFNSGVMVLEPSQDVFDRMLAALKQHGSYDGGDQGFLNEFLGDWYAMPVENRLPVGYNMANFIYQFMRAHPHVKATLEKNAKIIHFLVQKPWQARTILTGGSEAWFTRYFEVYPEKAHSWSHKLHAFEDSTFDYLSSLVLD
jgi:alpha-N-acetylglucosamine transferase